jgi:hypothetical protein
MNRIGHVSALAVAVLGVTVATPVPAEVLDAVYRGTLVCDRLPFTDGKMREAIVVTIARGAVRYTHVVRLRGKKPEREVEQGTGTLTGQVIQLQGSWQEGGRQYHATYGGTFVRRSARLRGSQTWTAGGRQFSRACSGAVKRPFKAFLPRRGRPASP